MYSSCIMPIATVGETLITTEVPDVVPVIVTTASEVRPHSKLLLCESGESTISSTQPMTEQEAAPLVPSSQQTEDTQKDVSETVSDVKEKDNPPAPRSVPIPVYLFGNHVETNHGNNNQPFLTEFDVRKLVST